MAEAAFVFVFSVVHSGFQALLQIKKTLRASEIQENARALHGNENNRFFKNLFLLELS